MKTWLANSYAETDGVVFQRTLYFEDASFKRRGVGFRNLKLGFSFIVSCERGAMRMITKLEKNGSYEVF